MEQGGAREQEMTVESFKKGTRFIIEDFHDRYTDNEKG